MGLRRIVTTRDADQAVLRGQARAVHKFDRELKRLAFDMVDTMREAPGVGLAAPQIGQDLRLIVVETPRDGEDPEADELRLWQVVNPVIEWWSEEMVEAQEACLSIPGLYGDVPRHSAVRVRGQDVTGRTLVIEVEDFEARVFQHEIDHLDGILFPDRVTGLDKLYTLRETEDGEFERVPYRVPV